MFVYLEGTSLALWVSLSLWAYPMLLAAHIVGLSTAVGLFAMRDLSCLSLLPRAIVVKEGFRGFHRLALFGLLVNSVSGFLLFSSQASYLAGNGAFLSKMACVVLGSLTAIMIQRRLEGTVTCDSIRTRLLAVFSLTLWLAAIVAGRLIAYWI